MKSIVGDEENIYNIQSYIKQGDCLELIKEIPDKSINLLLTDLPYSIKNRNRVTGNFWDIPIDIDLFWDEAKRVLIQNGAIVLTATNPFASYLIMKYRMYHRLNHILSNNLPFSY